MSIQDIDFSAEAQQYAPVDSGDVYFYSLDNQSINVRKKCATDFETWVVTYNHFDDTSVIITGAAPVENATDYTLLHHIKDFVKQPVQVEPEESPEAE